MTHPINYIFRLKYVDGDYSCFGYDNAIFNVNNKDILTMSLTTFDEITV